MSIRHHRNNNHDLWIGMFLGVMIGWIVGFVMGLTLSKGL